MTISIRCPHCQDVRAINPRVMGREIRCPSCDRAFLADASLQVIEREESIREDSSESEVVEVESAEVEVNPRTSVGTTPAVSSPTRPSRPTPHEEDEPEAVAFEKKELPKDDMDMTPMVDVTFLLLIFFMITASFSSEKVFEKPPPMAQVGRSDQPPPPAEDTVKVQIDEFNAYTIIFSTGDEREASSKQDLLIGLGDARAEVTTGKDDDVVKLIVEAHEECMHGSIITALDCGREKGFNSFTVSVVEEFE